MSWDERSVEELNEELLAIVSLEEIFLALLNNALSIDNFKTLKGRQYDNEFPFDHCILKHMNSLLAEVCYFSGYIYVNMFFRLDLITIEILEPILILLVFGSEIPQLVFPDLNLKGDVAHVILLDFCNGPSFHLFTLIDFPLSLFYSFNYFRQVIFLVPF